MSSTSHRIVSEIQKENADLMSARRVLEDKLNENEHELVVYKLKYKIFHFNIFRKT
jgi:hypothetical protein